jgi:hypothetical protein
MVEHICIGNKAIGLNTLYLDTKDSTGHHHPNFRVFSKWELNILRDLFTNQFVISFDILNFFMNLVKKGTSLQPILFFLSEEDWEIREVLG